VEITTKDKDAITLYNFIKQQIVTAPFKINAYSSKIYKSPIQVNQLFLKLIE
jgi:hypothetical protein